MALNLKVVGEMIEAMGTPEYRTTKDHLVVFRHLAKKFPHATDEETVELLDAVYNATRSELRPNTARRVIEFNPAGPDVDPVTGMRCTLEKT